VESEEIRQETIHIPEVKPVTYDEVVGILQSVRDGAEVKALRFKELLDRVVDQPVARRLPEDVLDAGSYATYRRPEQYATMPREYVQGRWGGGRPYDTRDSFHFTMRYAMGPQSANWTRVWLGVFAETPRLMAEREAQERSSRDAVHLLSLGNLGDKIDPEAQSIR
jgi:hypothetical protein